MIKFNEDALEQAIIEMFIEEGWQHVPGNEIHREKTDVLVEEDLRFFLADRYANEGITENEIESILLRLRTISGSVYESNKAAHKLIVNGFILNREDRTQKDFLVELINYTHPDRNIYKIVNQAEVQGYELRIPDAILYVNGLPLVVLEFKNAVRENTTISNAYDQLTVRYRRDIPEIFKYHAFVVISDGVNNKYGSLFAPYDYYYAWRRVDDDAPEADGISSLTSMVQGCFAETAFYV